MDKENYNNVLIKLLKQKKYDEFLNNVKTNNNINFDIPDNNYNYILNYLVKDNMYDIVKYLFDNYDLRLDITDGDGKNILYQPIKYDNMELLKLLIDYNKKIIGLDIINMYDNNGNTPLYYSCILNNYDAFIYLYNNDANIEKVNNIGNNVFEILFKFNRQEMLEYIVKEVYLKNNLNILTLKNETVIHLALQEENNKILAILMNLKLDKTLLDTRELEYGLSVLHQSIIVGNINVITKLIEQKADYNITDYIGNTPLHYALYEKNFEIVEILLNNMLEYNISNSTGDIALHLCFYNMDITRENDKYNYKNIFMKILKNSNVNHMNNSGMTPLHLMVEYGWWKDKDITNILISGELLLNIFIKNRENMTPLDIVNNSDREQLINIVVDSYYNNLILMKEKNDLEGWEKYCASNELENLLKELNKRSQIGKDIKYYCKEQIKKIIEDKKRSIPQIEDLEITIDSGIFMNNCFYTGSTLDILFGLVYLYNLNKNIGFILEYPLTENNKLTEYYKKLGIENSYKLEFTNIEILWIYQKIIYPTNFDYILQSKLKNDYIVIPLGIDINNNSHANIILIDNIDKTIERFEPNGANQPRGLNYNEDLLDDILINKFNNLLPEYNYFKPKQYLPIVGFQLLESGESVKCKKITDPNGFCAVWCVWWIEMRLINRKINRYKLARELINIIKLKNINFKDIIRNYSIKITKERDNILEKNNITIDDWIINNYDTDILNKIEEDVMNIIL